ncbi:hypothetical protein H257_18228 [Aphanomyces astaci]|uniref:DDE Tnp4 domain-containing protein n=1 Tax=Aphanomyces astaci TaxID=112090 RepID=W4FDJ2_APHAT|nr:hypothetical protein H257_18228 [Aphanomyces astaci]ETV64959.1 hypothetical protein H257_18228 [Aphanomyces astaci]|eukprot:XP_009845549.1 hypothetical protein H257_18228 [Aphanomyces astaci]
MLMTLLLPFSTPSSTVKDLVSFTNLPTSLQQSSTHSGPSSKAKFIDGLTDKWRMHALDKAGLCFKNYPLALYAVDVTFQQTNASAGSFAEKKRFFRKKHSLYGMKVEASVLPNGYAINVSNAVPGSLADITICYDNNAFHQYMLTKVGYATTMPDNGNLGNEYPNSGALLADKGYQGLYRHMRAITPAKRHAGGLLSVPEMTANDRIASDRVVVEHFFRAIEDTLDHHERVVLLEA